MLNKKYMYTFFINEKERVQGFDVTINVISTPCTHETMFVNMHYFHYDYMFCSGDGCS